MSQSNSQVDRWLESGIAAARQGRPALARELLLKVIAANERSEMAWLWLSGVVESDDDRRVCLENVLALNPESRPARKGLAILEAQLAAVQKEPVAGQVIRREIPAISPAAAILYPERQVQEWRWQDGVELQRGPEISSVSESSYDDIWENERDICAYCAGEVDFDDVRCPTCQRKLTGSRFRYPTAGADLIIYWVLLLGLGQIYFILVLTDIIVGAPWIAVVWHGILFIIMVAFAIGVAVRFFPAYVLSIIFMVFLFAVLLIDTLSGERVSGALLTDSGVAFFIELANNPLVTFLTPLLDYVKPLQMLALFLALLYGVLQAGPDFDRETIRYTAQVTKGLRDADHFYAAGKEYAAKGMWANTILHWQRAAAHDPDRAFYQQALGQAYGQLGFYQRSLDALGSARRLVTTEAARSELDQMIAAIRHQQQVASQPSAGS